ncbi:MAG: ABC transporter substrate-binding protein [Syntrophales bacterium]|jgi:branched-chain amino acid transport system substrate-binding protein|nr:ABC transporter substrate-binding protein [Syntrophales bacterium]MDY0043082.1 ABC transporter substrate-binding protein [Syntrophales bacterium]
MLKRILMMVLCISSAIIVSGSICASFAEDPVKIGYIGALSTVYGESNLASLEISIDELNKEGGILGRPVELITEDWKREIPLAVAAYKKLVMKDRCLLVFAEGTEGSMACAQTASRLYPSYPHVLFSIWSSGLNMDIVADEYEKYKFLFLVYPGVSDTYNPALEVLDFFRQTIGTRKLALLIEDIGWTETYRKGKPGSFPPVKEFAEKGGIEVVYQTTTDIKEKMFLPILEKVAASGADTIWFFSAYTDTVTFVKQWAQSPAKNLDVVMQSGACSYASFWKMTGGQALGIASMMPEIEIPFTKRTKPFLKKLREKGAGLMASTFSAYDGPWILKGAVEKTGSADDVEAIIKAVETGEFQRGSWIWSFNRRHEPKKGSVYQPYPIGQFQEDGKYVVVHSKNLLEITNPNDSYLRVRDLRKRVEQ